MKRFKNKVNKMVSPCWKAITAAALCLGILLGHAVARRRRAKVLPALRAPKTLDPLKVEDDASAAIRYLTGGVLVRVNRQTQELEPGLALSWKVSKRRPADLVPLAQRSFLFRWHPFFGLRTWLTPSSN